ncbi:unnamed protein product [Rhizoctonia solani]|uniref:Uncharacterized protein n=1 Tax=Rhizoctonia solani TaxID=456999 RepID=A0A8H3DIW2_9AGAM|nr:unnamed protein product [Rhizoctonia solani]
MWRGCLPPPVTLPNTVMPEANDTFPTTLLKWEMGGANLTTALSAYLESCAFLSTYSLSQDARTVASRMDISLDTLHSKFSEELSRSRLLLARMRNKILAPSFSLPREILAEIFKDVVYIPGLNETLFPSMTEGLKRIFGRLHTLLAPTRIHISLHPILHR